ncbi:MAG: hypothetical protein IJI47_02135 [Eubacterium sp.]|nr:hypothetical protein [Eubacterium sp.]MBR0412356.1 hypothetical protein [Eubacterium sp.]
MNTIFYHPEIRGLLSLWLLFICLALVWSVMQLWQQKRYKVLVPTLMFFAACDIYWQYLNANSYYVGVNSETYRIDYAPIWLIVLINAILTVAVVCYTLQIARWQKNHISAVSIKESFDTLPTGICFYENGGRIYLVNNAMDTLTQKFAGQHLYNGERFWDILKEKSISSPDENGVVVEIDGRTYAFSKHPNAVKGQEFYELIAADITEEAAQNRELERKNADLEQLNRMLEEYDSNLAQIVHERELLQSKVKIHDDMNVLLISTMNSIENYDESEAKRVSAMWKEGVLELQRDTAPYRKNPLETLESLAESLGIALEFSGVFPDKNENVGMLITAASECMVNAIRHAGAKTVFINSTESGFTITNDGNPPACEITEGGGLSNIRSRAEKINAEFGIISTPEFILQIRY